jgi:hypothetical protein
LLFGIDAEGDDRYFDACMHSGPNENSSDASKISAMKLP